VINHHIDTFAGLPVVEFAPDQPPPADPGAVAIRLSSGFEETEQFQAAWDALFAADWVGQVPALVIGDWGDAYDSAIDIEDLAAQADRLTSLRARTTTAATSTCRTWRRSWPGRTCPR